MRYLLFVALVACCVVSSGCAVKTLDGAAPQSKKPADTKPVDNLPPAPAELVRQVKEAFGGNKAAASDFWGLYSAAADAATDERYCAKAAELLDGLETGRELMGHPHKEFPKLTEVVRDHLGGLTDPGPLTPDKRKSWRQALQELAAACRAVS